MTPTIEEAARGYVCLDCNNSELFKGMSNLFRLYKPISENFDFNNEIVCPETISCYECSSKNIGIEISPNKIITKHMMSEGSGAWLVGEKWLLDVDDNIDLKELIKIIVESEGENNYEKLHNQLIEHGFNEWNMDSEFFSKSRFSLALVYISSGGIIRQDEYGLMDEDSSYNFARYIGF
tara:strand:- start:14 stop:550 length:537 start_codon:yes stop_codon:yes gene_type:complete